MPRDTIIDTVTGGAAISLPFWIDSINIVVQEFLIIGGAILLVLRIALAVRAWRCGPPDPPARPGTLGTEGRS